MQPQDFIFTSGIWLGEGKISFSNSPEFIKFYTKWEIAEESPKVVKAVQVVEMQGVEEHVINIFRFKDITPTSFSVSLENILVGTITGTGLRAERLIAWEFRGKSAIEGFETYEQQENGDYFLHAEYGTPDQFRTIIEGLIWRKGS
jgi:hypothetical protein